MTLGGTQAIVLAVAAIAVVGAMLAVSVPDAGTAAALLADLVRRRDAALTV